MGTEKKQTFNEVAGLYDQVRNRYPAALLDELFRAARLAPGARVLEIGAGTGIFTLELAKRGCRVLGVELGEAMAAVARRKLAAYADVAIEVAPFEAWSPPDEKFDLVVAATAFHWLDPRLRFVKSADLLRDGGHLAIVNYFHVAGGDRSFFERVQTCYERHMPGTPPNLRLPEPAELAPDTESLEASGLFGPPLVYRFVAEETYDTGQYVKLLSTYSTHRMLEPAERQNLLACVGALVDRDYGGRVRKSYLHELIVARKSDSGAGSALA